MKQIIILFSLIVILLSACKKERQAHNLCDEPNINSNNCLTDTNQVKTAILGRWDWTQSINSWTQAKTNPCTDTINRGYEFFADGTVKYFENNSYVTTGTYQFSVSQGMTIHAYNPTLNFALAGWVSVCDDYLIVDDSRSEER